jgi:hypothetical protein
VEVSTPVFSLLGEPLQRVSLLLLCLFTGLAFELVFQDSQAPLTLLLCHDLDFASVVALI